MNGLIETVKLRTVWRLAGAIAACILLISSISLITPSLLPARAAGPWYVAPGGSDANGCLSAGSPCATINGAIGKATAGDTIKVAIGTYTGNSGGEVVLLDKDIILSGGWSIDFTTQGSMSTIDGEIAYQGIRVVSGTVATVRRFIVQNTVANSGISRYGSGVYNDEILILENSIIEDNLDDYSVYNLPASQMTLNDSLVISNNGGGIKNDGTLTVNHSSISDNGFRGIENSGTLTINNSAITGNSFGNPTEGGGILNTAGTLIMNNSTVSYNDNGSGNVVGYYGGGIYSNGNSATTILNNTTVSFNSAGSGGGGIFNGFGMYSMTLRNTIVANNTVLSSFISDCLGNIISAGYNLIGEGSGCTFTPNTGDLLNVNAGLSPTLVSSPGVHPLFRLSPAINAGNPEGCTDHLGNPLDFDQRGAPRVGRCDIGSFEYDPATDPFEYIYLPLIFRDYCHDFFDNFSNPASGWAVGEDDFVHSEYLNGEYRVLSKQKGFYYLFTSPSCDRQNYMVEVDARWIGTPGASYGLIFGILGDFDQFYLFEINTDFQEYELLRFDPTNVYTIVDITPSTAIHSGTATNHLKVTSDGSQITLEVNGVVLGSWFDGNITGLTGVGLATSPYEDIPSSDARFDNFSVAKITSLAASAGLNAVTTSAVERDIHRESWHLLKRSWRR